MEEQTNLQSLWARIKEMVTLKYEYARLTLAEKLSLLLAMTAIAIIAFMTVTAVLFFLSVALSHLLAESVGQVWSSVIVAGIYLFVLIAVLAMRKQLIINPITRFVTRLMLH